MGRLASFLPPHVLARLARGTAGTRVPALFRYEAALLLSDISGFTALTERLQARGRAGAEEVARVVTGAFRPAIDAIAAEGGSIVGFGGDAIFSVFPGAGGARRAWAAAEEIRSAFSRQPMLRTSAGPVALGIAQALHHGRVEEMHLGGAGWCHVVVGGDASLRLARLQSRSSAGAIVVSAAARSRRTRERASPAPMARPGAPRPAALAALLDPRLRPLARGFQGGFRRTAVLFLETAAITGEAALGRMQAWFSLLAEELLACDGVLLKSDLSASGTKWLCVFGLPTTHEDDVERAARVALSIATRRPQGLRVRAALHAGVVARVIVGSHVRRGIDVMGDAVNTAARALAAGRFGEVIVTAEALHALPSATVRDRGLHAAKGKAAPLRLHALDGVRRAFSHRSGGASLVGRDEELALLHEIVAHAVDGKGTAVALSGEPGVGKSRLVAALADMARARGFEIHEGRAISYRGMPYWAAAELLRRTLGLREGSPPTETLDRLREECRRLELSDTDRLHLGDVLGIREEGSPLHQLDARVVHLNDMLALQSFLRARSKRAPQLWILEDMHWADQATREATAWICRDVASARAVVLLVQRDGHPPPAECVKLALRGLTPGHVEALVRHLLDRPSEPIERLVKERAEGNPFYVEELVRHLVDRDLLERGPHGDVLRRQLRTDELPDGIEGLIEARLDQLGPRARRVAQVGAVVGRSFLLDVLAEVPEIRPFAAEGVQELAERGLVTVQEREPRAQWIFTQALTRDVAYATLLEVHRGRLHRAVAASMERVLPPATYDAIIGHHWERGGRPARARTFFLAGARRAARSYALEEAAALYRSHLALARRPSRENVEARLELVAQALRPAGAPEQEIVTESEAAVAEAVRLRDPVLQARAHHGLGWMCHLRGRIERAVEEYEVGLQFARLAKSFELEVKILANLAALRHAQGQFDEAGETGRRVLEIASAVGDERAQAHALTNLAVLEDHFRRGERARGLMTQALELHRRIGDRRAEAVCLANLAIFANDAGRSSEARELMAGSLEIRRSMGDRPAEAIAMALLGQILVAEEQLDEAERVLTRAREQNEGLGQRRWEAVVALTIGDLHARRGQLTEADTFYADSMRIDRELGDLHRVGIGALMRATTLRRLGHYAPARSLWEEARSLLSGGKDPWRVASLHIEGGHLALAEGDAAAAARCLDEARHHARALTDRILHRTPDLEPLQRAIDAFGRGARLQHGELPSR